ncbi:MAG: single-stranded-DNA-specific exonuclease RecJ [Dehalococcoidales bacterium]|nr:single-stranded-DNA-specific exonuclease RecJ [Dehalococcoidales bacterium]
MNHKRWNLRPPLSREHLLLKSGFSPLMSQLLVNRGIEEPAAAWAFLKIDPSLSPDPFLLHDIEPAVSRIYRALLGAEKVAVYGDFDADGITATALLMSGLSQLGINVVPYLPHRLDEGHGLKIAALEKLHEEGVTLVITVDCGITGAAAVKRANRLGLDIIITDHHTPTQELPPALAVVNPKHPDSVYPFKDLAGVGVAYKLLQAVNKGLNKTESLHDVLDLVAVGTVADMTPMLGENRYLVNQGLQQMNLVLRMGFKELLTKAGMKDGKLSANNITWMMAPRINTASRLHDALPSYELMMTSSLERAQALAEWLESKNLERQQITQAAAEAARQQVHAKGVQSLLVIESGEFPAGVSGLVAGRMTDEFYRPTIVVKSGKRVTSGSCRSIPEFNIVEALTRCGDLFLDFGGHAQAAGFTLLTHNMAILEARLLAFAEHSLEGVDLRPRIDIDAEVNFKDLTGEAYADIQKLEPYGQQNPAPVFVSRKVRVISCRTMGNSAEHLRLRLQQGEAAFDAVAFNAGDNIKEITTTLDIVYNLELDQWNGRNTLRLNLMDFTKAR